MRRTAIVEAVEAGPLRVRTPLMAPPGHAILRVGPWPMPLTDQQRQMMDRMIARARARALPFLAVSDDGARRCVAFVVEPLPSASSAAAMATEGVLR